MFGDAVLDMVQPQKSLVTVTHVRTNDGIFLLPFHQTDHSKVSDFRRSKPYLDRIQPSVHLLIIKVFKQKYLCVHRFHVQALKVPTSKLQEVPEQRPDDHQTPGGGSGKV
ncbi:hypothetical protein L218DRAFT_968382 [Marasmius fiardii PR-910]|nr:hypothetical protein L218DRAFT_968382 [Marasmius fiardii PR-910]